jgi:hypothetical protein
VSGFTKTGQPIQGRRYVLDQSGVGLPEGGVEVRVVGKFFGPGGAADLVGIMVEEVESKGREMFPWPIESTDPERPITFRVAS